MFRLDPIIDIPTCLDQTKTVGSENLEGQGFVLRTIFTPIEICMAETQRGGRQ